MAFGRLQNHQDNSHWTTSMLTPCSMRQFVLASMTGDS